MSYTWVSADKLVLLCPILSSHGNVTDLAEPFCYHLCTVHSNSVLTLYLDSATKIATFKHPHILKWLERPLLACMCPPHAPARGALLCLAGMGAEGLIGGGLLHF